MNRKLSVLILAVMLPLLCACSSSTRMQWRFAKLEKLVDSGALSAPRDMVIYRYDSDTLQSWVNVFPVKNDALTISVSGDALSPLAQACDTAKLVKLSNHDFLIKSKTQKGPLGENLRTIYGLDLGLHKSRDNSALVQKRPPLLFSPLLFAGRIFHSLGSMLIFNCVLCLMALFLMLFYRKNHRLRLLNIILALSIPVIAFLELRSISLNSDINLELYKLRDLTVWSGLVYLSFLLLFLCMPVFLRHCGVDVRSRKFRLSFAASVGTFLLVSSAVMGFDKECRRLSVWAERLSIDRDITLELRLRRNEGKLASDAAVPGMIMSGGTQAEIAEYVIQTYFNRIAQDYDVSVLPVGSFVKNPEIEQYISDNLRDGESVYPGSRYLYSNPGGERLRYTGLFMYLDHTGGLCRLLVGVEAKLSKENRGYARILGLTPPGSVEIPYNYSYAKYKTRTLQSFRGNYPYPTHLDDSQFAQLYGKQNHFVQDSFRHFVTRVTDDEVVLISRHVIPVFIYLIALAFISVVFFVILTAVFPTVRHRGERHFYRNRISFVLMLSLTLTLVAMMGASIFFVSERDNANMQTMMSDKINSIRSMLENRLREADLNSSLQTVSEIAGTDIVLCDPGGRIFKSTSSEIFERGYLGGRINSDAYRSIVGENKQYFIQKERMARTGYYNMYAPLLDERGVLRAIICAPYTDDSFDFERDAVMHSAAILTVFLILLHLARLLSSAMLDRMLSPLGEMGRKMLGSDLNSLEHIEYSQKDEILPIVTAYNRMVDDLSESSRKLAQAERDKAWTGMARQVAHEIKNPLTPMKLQIQRLIRLKQKGDPQWQDKFDDVCKVVLDHIDILADAAGEFSVIAQLPTEQVVLIDLGKLIPEEISMFDNRDDIQFEYYGLDEAFVEGPKPQFTRVIVNLLTNAVQALDGVPGARIIVSLSKSSSRSDAYDIVVEDNGPGVSEENRERLFTENFTTKTGGSGLGLAISRSILERCGATISYSKSFHLGGASFVICYPAKTV